MLISGSFENLERAIQQICNRIKADPASGSAMQIKREICQLNSLYKSFTQGLRDDLIWWMDVRIYRSASY